MENNEGFLVHPQPSLMTSDPRAAAEKWRRSKEEGVLEKVPKSGGVRIYEERLIAIIHD